MTVCIALLVANHESLTSNPTQPGPNKIDRERSELISEYFDYHEEQPGEDSQVGYSLMGQLAFVLSLASLWLASLLSGCSHGRNHVRASDPEPGRIRFETYCAGCHLNEGPWMRGEAPPLEGSSWVAGPENRVIKIVLHGLRGSIEVRSQTYNQEMPGFGPILTDADIASLLSYVRKRFGGAGTPISEAAVSLIRAANQGRTDYWTVDELSRDP